MHLHQYFKDFIGLFFPTLCLLCWRETPVRDSHFCVACTYEMPYTDHFETKNNLFSQRFWGRIELDHGAALIHFHKESRVQKMMHQFKYNKKRQVGIALGNIAGKKMMNAPYFKEISTIIPVPLYWKKEKVRGYNQSMIFAQGISEVTKIPVAPNILIKKTTTSSQTSKTRMERIKNVEDTFDITNDDQLKDKHVLLVDDVITTGATLESCASKLMEKGVSKISMVTIAIARH